jgi:hypothetical protein
MTIFRVFRLTLSGLLSALETVDGLTPANFAMS